MSFRSLFRWSLAALPVTAVVCLAQTAPADEDFATLTRRLQSEKPQFAQRQQTLKVERFFREVTINGRTASADGPIKTFPLRGIKDSPPYLHDDRLLTLDDTVEFFNLVLELNLDEQDKKDLVALMRVL